MSLALMMVVKDESRNVDETMREMLGAFQEVLVIDTGSSDDTIERFRDAGAHVASFSPPLDDMASITSARNYGLSRIEADWVLVLDADERMTLDSIETLKARLQHNIGAIILTWRNRRDGSIFDDYKLSAFKTKCGIEYEGMVHSNPQRSVRRLKIPTTFYPDIVISHCLDERRPSRVHRRARLVTYVAQHPTWWRYQWFLGYDYFKSGQFDLAVPILRDTCNSLSLEFPIECLNSHVVLIDINARKGEIDKCRRIHRQAETFLDSVRGDFEIQANPNLETWLNAAGNSIQNADLESIRAYEFAF